MGGETKEIPSSRLVATPPSQKLTMIEETVWGLSYFTTIYTLSSHIKSLDPHSKAR